MSQNSHWVIGLDPTPSFLLSFSVLAVPARSSWILQCLCSFLLCFFFFFCF